MNDVRQTRDARPIFRKISVDSPPSFFKFSLSTYAGVAQLVEHYLAKVDVESSNLFARSIFLIGRTRPTKHPPSRRVFCMNAADLFDFPSSLPFAGTFQPELPPWEWVSLIDKALAGMKPVPGPALPPGVHVEGAVCLHPTVKLPPYCVIIGPAWIGPHCEIRPGAYIRGGVIAGEGCVLGHACEFKHCLLLDGAQVPHLSYVGDSILGNGAHLGAGVVLSNLRLDQGDVPVRLPGRSVSSGMRKLGAMLGDRAEVGCNAVLQPGTVLGRRSLVMPSMAFGGFLEAKKIARVRQPVHTLPLRD